MNTPTRPYSSWMTRHPEIGPHSRFFGDIGQVKTGRIFGLILVERSRGTPWGMALDWGSGAENGPF